MKKLFLLVMLPFSVAGQSDSTIYINTDTASHKSILNMDAVYERPFLQFEKVPVALGGYIEANTHYSSTDGVSEGISFQARRMTLFVSSTVYRRIKFLSEIEFEEGGKEINIEFASLDVELHPMLNLRGGIVMNPIGAFNQNHDGPKWEFVERPYSAVTIIPSTFSNAGFGLFGKYGKSNWVYGYEFYLTNGFDDRIISNSMNRTWLPATKENNERFEESFNGEPLVTAKIAVKNRKVGEVGLSWMGGIYNKFMDDGIELDKKRRIDLIAVDFNTNIKATATFITGEFVWAALDIPSTYTQQFGAKQMGGFADIVQTVLKKEMLGWQEASLNAAIRFEYADYNDGTFAETGTDIYDHIYSVSPAISFRPTPQTVFRINYRYEWHRDLLGNPASHYAALQFGFSSYF